MTLPDDIELREEVKRHVLTAALWREHVGASNGKEYLDTDRAKENREQGSDKVTELILKALATYRTKWETEARVDELEALSSPKFLRNIRTTITDSNGEVYTDDSHMYISKFEVQERILELKEKTND